MGQEEERDMKKVRKSWKFWGILLGLLIFAAGFTVQATTVETKSGYNGIPDDQRQDLLL